MITVYQTKYRAWLTLQLGWEDSPVVYRIKDYSLRKVENISTASLRRIERLLTYPHSQFSDCTESWFKTVYSFPKQ